MQDEGGEEEEKEVDECVIPAGDEDRFATKQWSECISGGPERCPESLPAIVL